MINIIPAIDILNGECIRLTQGDYNRKVTYYKNPLTVAKMYEEIGITRIHIVDLDGAKNACPQNLSVVEQIIQQTSLEVQFGGGIKSNTALEQVFDAGVSYAICGSISVTAPNQFQEWLNQYPDKIILGADVNGVQVAIHGWQEKSTLTIYDLIDRFQKSGLKQVICTDISKDGMLAGPNFGLYDELQKKYAAIEITASGGVSSFDDIIRLEQLKIPSIIVGKAIYEGSITNNEIKQWLQKG